MIGKLIAKAIQDHNYGWVDRTYGPIKSSINASLYYISRSLILSSIETDVLHMSLDFDREENWYWLYFSSRHTTVSIRTAENEDSLLTVVCGELRMTLYVLSDRDSQDSGNVVYTVI